MRNKLIDQYGAYKVTSFIGSIGKWTLIGSEVLENESEAVMNTLDTFKSDKGEYKSLKRSEVDKLFEAGKIKI